MSASGVHYTNPASGSMSPQSQSPFVRLLPTADPNTPHQVPVYATTGQEVARHAVPVPVGAAPLRQHNGPQNQNTRPIEQNVGEHNYRYSGNHPTPLQIPPPSVNPQHPNPSPSTQPHPALFPMSPHDRSSSANNTQSARRHSDPSHPPHSEKPHPASQPTFDPLIMSATDVALAPVRSALDTVWTLSVNNMRLAMNKMNNDFTYLATQERHRTAHLASKVTSLETHLHAASQDLQILRKERQELQNIIQAYKEQNRKLNLEKEHWEIERRVLMEGRRGDSHIPQVDMNKVLGAVTEQVSKEMEQKMTAILNQIEEQKTSRTQAERRFSETLQHLSDIHNRESSETLPVVQQSPYVLAQSPPLQRGSHSPASTCVVSPDLSKAKLPSNAQQVGTDGASTPITPTDCRSMTPAVILKDSTLVSTPAEIHTPSAMHTSPSPTRNTNLVRRTPSLDQPRKRPRLMNEGEDECSTPNPQSPGEVMKADHILETLPENVPSPMQQLSESIYDEGGPFSGTVTIKPEPLEEQGKMDIEDSKGVTPSSSSPSRRATPAEWAPARKPTPMPHRTSISNALPVNQRNTKLGIGHIDLLYRTDNGVMTCRMCLSRSRDLLLSRDRSSKVAAVKKFEQTKATWDELVTHCRDEHSKTCRDLERLGPTQLAEMKQRLMSGEKSAIARKLEFSLP